MPYSKNCWHAQKVGNRDHETLLADFKWGVPNRSTDDVTDLQAYMQVNRRCPRFTNLLRNCPKGFRGSAWFVVFSINLIMAE